MQHSAQYALATTKIARNSAVTFRAIQTQSYLQTCCCQILSQVWYSSSTVLVYTIFVGTEAAQHIFVGAHQRETQETSDLTTGDICEVGNASAASHGSTKARNKGACPATSFRLIADVFNTNFLSRSACVRVTLAEPCPKARRCNISER